MPFPPPYPALIVLGLVALLRLWELAVSRARLRAARAAGTAEAIPEPGYRAMVLVHLGWWLGCAAETVWRGDNWPAAVALPAGAAWLAALGLRAWMMAALGGLWNVRLVARTGQPIVTGGPYRWVRHPNYLAVIVEIAAVPLLVGAPLTALLGSAANAWVLRGRIAREEAYLGAFPAWRRAFAHKKRLLPGVF